MRSHIGREHRAVLASVEVVAVVFARPMLAGVAAAGLLGLATYVGADSSAPSAQAGQSHAASAPSPAPAPAPSAAPRPVTSSPPAAGDTGNTQGEHLFTGATYAATARSRPSTGGVALRAAGKGPLKGTSVVLDPGHNGASAPRITSRQVPDGRGGTKACNTAGTSTDAGYEEHRHNWAVAAKAAEKLQQLGATVVLTRPDNAGVGPCVDERAAIANRFAADIVVSIHADGAAATVRGFHVIHSTGMAGGSDVEKRSAQAAVLLRDAYAKHTGLPRSTYLGAGTGLTPRPDIAGLNHSRVPAVMLEAGNMRHPIEARLLSSFDFHGSQADAIVEGIRGFLRR